MNTAKIQISQAIAMLQTCDISHPGSVQIHRLQATACGQRRHIDDRRMHQDQIVQIVALTERTHILHACSRQIQRT